MRISEIPITVWNGKFLDGVLTISTYQILEPLESDNELIARDVYITLVPQSNDMHYTGKVKINNTDDSVMELLNTIMYEYTDLVQLFKNRELENGTISLH